MALWMVRKEEIHVVEIEVQAKDEDSARDKVHRGLGRQIGCCEFDRVNSITVDDWEVNAVRITGRKKGR